jgi:GNAT superfamily N-acetyltransferase
MTPSIRSAQTTAFHPTFPSADVAIGLFSMMFSHPGFYCVVAESDGRTVGSNCLDERSAIAGLGPITVDPSIQDRGVGRKLMEAVLVRARERNFPGVRLLQSAFHNRSLALYSSLGFDAREPVSVMQGSPLRKQIEGCSVRPARVSDVEDCKRLCMLFLISDIFTCFRYDIVPIIGHLGTLSYPN